MRRKNNLAIVTDDIFPPNLNEFIVKHMDFSFKSHVSRLKFELWIAKKDENDKLVYAKQVPKKSKKNDISLFYEQCSKICHVKHSFISDFVGVTKSPPYTAFAEVIPGRSLHDILSNSELEATLDGSHTTFVAMAVADALDHLNKRGLSVPFLSTESIFISKDLVPMVSLIEEGTVNPPVWTPPEVYKGKVHDEKSDVFMFSFVLFELLTGSVPFQGLTTDEAEKEICCYKKRPQIPPGSPEPLVKLIKHCWSPKRVNRPSFEDIYNLFYSGIVFFPDAKYSKIIKLTRKFKHLKKRKIPQTYFDLYSTVTSLKRAKKYSSNTTQTATDINTFENSAIVSQRDFKATFNQPVNFSQIPSPTKLLSEERQQTSDPRHSIILDHYDKQNSNDYEHSSYSSQQNTMDNQHIHSDKTSSTHYYPPVSNETNGSNNDVNKKGNVYEYVYGYTYAATNHDVSNPSLTEKADVVNNVTVSNAHIYNSTQYNQEPSNNDINKGNILHDSSFANENSKHAQNSLHNSSGSIGNRSNYSGNGLGRSSADEQKILTLDLDINVFDDYLAPEFTDAMNNIDKIVDLENMRAFFSKVPVLMKKMVPGIIKKMTIEAIIKLARTKEAFQILHDDEIICKLQNKSPESYDALLDLINICIHYSYNFVTYEFTRVFTDLIYERPEKMMVIYALISEGFGIIPEKETICEQIVTHKDRFLSSGEPQNYLMLLSKYLCFDSFREKYSKECEKIFLNRLENNDDTKIVRAAYKGIISLGSKTTPIPFRRIAQDLEEPELAPYALTALSRVKNEDPSKELIQPLLILAKKYRLATELLLRMFTKNYSASSAIIDMSWMSYNLPTFQDTLRIFICVFNHTQLRTTIVSSPELPNFLTKLIEHDNDDTFNLTGLLITQLPLTKAHIALFQQSGFYKSAFSRLDTTLEEPVKINCLRAITKLSEIGFSEELVQNTDKIKNALLYGDLVTKAAFSAVCSMSFHPRCLKSFKECGIDKIAESLRGVVDARTLNNFLLKVQKI